MIDESESTSPNPAFGPLAYAVGCEDCERIKDFSPATRTALLVRSQYSDGGLVCQECEEERARVEALVDIDELVSRLRELGWEDASFRLPTGYSGDSISLLPTNSPHRTPGRGKTLTRSL
jgi:hypothetical protein